MSLFLLLLLGKQKKEILTLTKIAYSYMFLFCLPKKESKRAADHLVLLHVTTLRCLQRTGDVGMSHRRVLRRVAYPIFAVLLGSVKRPSNIKIYSGFPFWMCFINLL